MPTRSKGYLLGYPIPLEQLFPLVPTDEPEFVPNKDLMVA